MRDSGSLDGGHFPVSKLVSLTQCVKVYSWVYWSALGCSHPAPITLKHRSVPRVILWGSIKLHKLFILSACRWTEDFNTHCWVTSLSRLNRMVVKCGATCVLLLTHKNHHKLCCVISLCTLKDLLMKRTEKLWNTNKERSNTKKKNRWNDDIITRVV